MQLGLGERRRDVELAPEAHAGAGCRGRARRPTTTPIVASIAVAVGVGEREVAHWLREHLAVGVGVEQRGRARDGSARRIRISQPAPYGSSFTVSGASTTAWLTSSTSPESGAIRSETALTDSTSPYDASFATVEPTSGGS